MVVSVIVFTISNLKQEYVIFHNSAAPTIAPTLTTNSPVVETQPGRLECRWTPILNETITYTWREINNNRIVNSEMEGDVSVVKFNRISRNDAGRYTCTITTAGGSITGGPVQIVIHCELNGITRLNLLCIKHQ